MPSAPIPRLTPSDSSASLGARPGHPVGFSQSTHSVLWAGPIHAFPLCAGWEWCTVAPLPAAPEQGQGADPSRLPGRSHLRLLCSHSPQVGGKVTGTGEAGSHLPQGLYSPQTKQNKTNRNAQRGVVGPGLHGQRGDRPVVLAPWLRGQSPTFPSPGPFHQLQEPHLGMMVPEPTLTHPFPDHPQTQRAGRKQNARKDCGCPL